MQNEKQVFLDKLKSQLGTKVSTNSSILEHHSRGESWHTAHLPDAVVFPESTNEVKQVVELCNSYQVPIVPFGIGSSLEGHVVPLFAGVSIDFSKMNKILEISPENLYTTVQAGVTRIQLNETIKSQGIFFPVDPGANATLGGMAATRASGTCAVGYGTMKDNVLGMQVVLADGRIIKTGSKAKKSSAGYDLTRLFIGSEGTLGVITELTLKSYGIPEAMSAAVCSFKTLEGAVQTAMQIIQMGLAVARIELLDGVLIDAVNRYSHLNLPISDTLFFEFHGTNKYVIEQAEIAQEIAKDNGGENFVFRTKPEERNELWKARHNVFHACKALRPGAEYFTTDVCVPISNLAKCILETKEEIKKSFLIVPIVGHVGDGNFHLSFLLDPNKPEEFKEAYRISERMVYRALELGGTCTGEHGIGNGKIKYLLDEAGEAVQVMKSIKIALDPKNIMNPGKIF